VTVRLAGVNGDTQTALASGGDATGDKLSSIEGLIGSGGGDRLTGNSLDNLLAGGLGSDVLNGMNGTDTVDYSRDHFFDASDTADRVEVHLGLGGANGTGDEFTLQGDGTFKRVSTDTLTSIENVIGTAGSDIIVGNDLDNVLEGRGGSNVLDGGLGDDRLIGGSAIDTADYTSHDALAVQRGEQYVIALGVIGRPGSFTLSSSLLPGVLTVVESDVLIGIENVTGSNHAETITGSELANTLDGRGGSDTIDSGFGNDILIGNGGTDTASYLSHDGLPDDGSPDVISLGNGTSDGSYTRFQALGSIRRAVETDVLRSIENVSGSDSDEVINGNDGANVLDGRGGNDIIDGGLGNDVIIGNDGTDTASYLSHDGVGATLISIGLGSGGADGLYVRERVVGTQLAIETDVLRGIENVTGSDQSEGIFGNELDNVLDGRGGTDSIDGFLGNDVIIGGVGTDDTVGYTSHDSLPFLAGEVMRLSLGVGGADGSYTRSEIVNGVSQVVETDVLRGIEKVNGSSHSEIITGNEQDNTLSGRAGNDLLTGGGGNDTVFGGADDDVYDFTGGGLGTDRFFDESGTNDRVIVNSFNDILPFSPVDGTQTGRDGNDLVIVLTTGTFRIVDHFNGHQIESIATPDGQSMVLANGLVGGNGSGIIAGGKGGQTLDGRGGDDFLFGNNGNDRLIGGDGNDRLTGGHGGDTFVFGPGFGHDVVTDFSHADHIEFDGGLFHNFKQVLAASHQVGADTVITVDANDSITLMGVSLHSLHAGHFDFA
jgi:Ca2+-binding RTX toxin-like protein